MSNEDSAPIYSPERHNGEGGVISSIDWETITAEDLLTGRYDQSILEEAATGPKGTGRVAEEWGMETLTERQVALGLSILLFVTDPRNNADIDIPLDLSWEHYRMAVHLRRNPKKNQRIARMAELGLKQLEYIIGQHSQNYHNIEETPSTEVPPGADALTETVALTEASPSSPETSTDQNTYLPIQAHWWMHEFSGR